MGTNENKPDMEIIADIVREMREMKCHLYADRIEAAAKRETDVAILALAS